MGPASRTTDKGELGLNWVLDSILSPLAIVDQQLRLVAVNDAYCIAGGRSRAELIGVVLFEAFPPNPDDDLDTGPLDLRGSLERVFSTGRAEQMPLQRYDVQVVVGGQFMQRFWSITTSPVRRSSGGGVDYAIVHAEEVTSFVDERLRREAAGQQPRTAGQTEAVDTVFTAALRHAAALNAFAEALVSSSTTAEVARAYTGAGIDLVQGSGGAFVALSGDRLNVLSHRGVDQALASDTLTSFVRTGGRPIFRRHHRR